MRLQEQLATQRYSNRVSICNASNYLFLQAHEESVSLAKELLKMPPILPERTPRGEVIERDDRLAGATKLRMIFTDITHHKENKVSMSVSSLGPRGESLRQWRDSCTYSWP